MIIIYWGVPTQLSWWENAVWLQTSSSNSPESEGYLKGILSSYTWELRSTQGQQEGGHGSSGTLLDTAPLGYLMPHGAVQFPGIGAENLHAGSLFSVWKNSGFLFSCGQGLQRFWLHTTLEKDATRVNTWCESSATLAFETSKYGKFHYLLLKVLPENAWGEADAPCELHPGSERIASACWNMSKTIKNMT